jgi:DNA gyrase subunit A
VVINANTKETIAFFSNFGKVYVSRIYDLTVSGKGYGDPIQTLFHFQDQEKLVTALSSDPESDAVPHSSSEEQETTLENDDNSRQLSFFPGLIEDGDPQKTSMNKAPSAFCLVATRRGAGFCFDRNALREPTTRNGRALIRLRSGDEVVVVRPVQKPLLAIATERRILLTPVEQISVLTGAGLGIRLMNPDPPGVLDFFTVDVDDHLQIQNRKGKETEVAVAELPTYNRGAKGTVIHGGIKEFRVKARETDADEEDTDAETR